MFIGKIIKSDSHTNYVCRVYGHLEVEVEPSPGDFAFGRFVRVAVPKPPRLVPVETGAAPDNQRESITYLVAVIYNTLLLNPDFARGLGPRLTSEVQEVFSPDYISEKAVLVHLIALGMGELRIANGEREFMSLMQGVPPLSGKLGGEVETMSDKEVRAFHFFSDSSDPGSVPYLHLGYIPHIIAQQNNSLLPLAILHIIDQLERLFPQHLTLLSILKHNFAWRLKVETTD